MQAGNSDASILPDSPEPFALIAGAAERDPSPHGLKDELRRMGLRPEPVPSTDGVWNGISGPAFRLHLGSATVLIGGAAADAIAAADPDTPSTSLIAASLSPGWHGSGRCWIVIPEGLTAGGMQAAPMREFFKMMTLLIDLFDASHMFWSPAQLWSDAAQFRSSIAEMLVSGMPPVLHLVAFRRRVVEAAEIVRTHGLALFGGQEMEAPMPAGWTVAEMVRRLARLALDVILYGPVPGYRRLRGLDPGEWVALTPRPATGGMPASVRVEFGSDI